MLITDNQFNAPIEERLMIYPKPRQDLFYNLIDNYKIFLPSLKLLYAALNYDSELKVDYILIFSGVANGVEMILWDAPFIYSNRCIPAYRYAVKSNQHYEFFEYCKKSLCQMNRAKFMEYLGTKHCSELNNVPSSPNYWKSPNNAGKLIKGITDVSMLYRPSGFTTRVPDHIKDK